ncbi:MAG: hypothetical protein K8U57_37765 [Planctomycetes bacterium]|nr:hypothetical protein [Planctomycetota bacterium]
MPELSDPATLLALAGLLLVNTLVLGGGVALFRPGETGYFASYGYFAGWAICFGISFGFIALELIRIPFFFLMIAWWAAALMLFQLTIRQTLKLNIAQGVIYLAILFAFAALLGDHLRD